MVVVARGIVFCADPDVLTEGTLVLTTKLYWVGVAAIAEIVFAPKKVAK